jgi:flagellar basal body-associated protein FliL
MVAANFHATLSQKGYVMQEKPKRQTSSLTKTLLVIVLLMLAAVSAYYVFAVYIPATQQAATITNTVEEQR